MAVLAISKSPPAQRQDGKARIGSPREVAQEVQSPNSINLTSPRRKFMEQSRQPCLDHVRDLRTRLQLATPYAPLSIILPTLPTASRVLPETKKSALLPQTSVLPKRKTLVIAFFILGNGLGNVSVRQVLLL